MMILFGNIIQDLKMLMKMNKKIKIIFSFKKRKMENIEIIKYSNDHVMKLFIKKIKMYKKIFSLLERK